MSEPTAVSVILEPIGLIFSGLASIHWSWWASRVASLLALPWKLLLAPIRLIVRVVLVVLAPVILVLGYILAGLRAVLNFLASLEVSELPDTEEAAHWSVHRLTFSHSVLLSSLCTHL